MGETVRVRIAVVMNEAGDWCSAGWSGESEAELRAVANDGVPEGGRGESAVYWLTAELPVPKPVEAEAMVERELRDAVGVGGEGEP